jgi:outer membrane murein-binding lipoprotein Lpp
MPFDFMNMPADEAERICYAEGFENAAKLFARIAELEAINESLTEELDQCRTDLYAAKRDRAYGGAE